MRAVADLDPSRAQAVADSQEGVRALNDGVGVRTEIVHERLEDDRIIETGRDPFSPEIRKFMLSEALRFNRCVPIGLLYRRELHSEVGGYDESLGAVGDWELQLRSFNTTRSASSTANRWPSGTTATAPKATAVTASSQGRTTVFTSTSTFGNATSTNTQLMAWVPCCILPGPAKSRRTNSTTG